MATAWTTGATGTTGGRAPRLKGSAGLPLDMVLAKGLLGLARSSGATSLLLVLLPLLSGCPVVFNAKFFLLLA